MGIVTELRERTDIDIAVRDMTADELAAHIRLCERESYSDGYDDGLHAWSMPNDELRAWLWHLLAFSSALSFGLGIAVGTWF